jgi:hypothetical protein
MRSFIVQNQAPIKIEIIYYCSKKEFCTLRNNAP